MVVTDIFSANLESRCLLPLYSTQACCGFPSPADDYVQQFLDLNEHLIEHPAATFFVRAVGDSMIDAGIRSGDLLLVDKSVNPRNGDVVIAVIDGQHMVKRFLDDGDRMRLVSENPHQKPVEFQEGNEVSVWAVVLHVIHSFRSRNGNRVG